MARLRFNAYVALLCALSIAGWPGVLTDNTDSCVLAGYDIEPLKGSLWTIEEPCTALPNSTIKENCTYFFSICFNDWTFLDLCPSKQSACVKRGNTTSPLGDTTPKLISIDDHRFHVNYTAAATNNTKAKNTTVEFLCDPKQTLGGNHGAAGQVLVTKLTAQPRPSTGPDFVVKYAGACKPEPKPSGMGPGGQLFIIILVIGTLYFGGGAVYNHVNGARGIELLPHHWFWTNLPGYVVDGCLFVVRLVTCQGRPVYNQNPDYGATSPAGVSPSGRTYESL